MPTDPSPAATSAWTSQPAVVLLPCVPATPTRVRPTAASATTCCHGSSGIPRRPRRDELRVVGIDRGQRLGHRETVRPRRRPSRGSRRARARRRSPGPRAPACTGDGPPGSQPVTTAPARAARMRGRARPGAGRADDVDPLARPDRPGRPGRGQARPDPVRGGGHRRSGAGASGAAMRSSRRDQRRGRAPPLVVGPIAAPDEPADGDARPRPRRRRRSARPAWPALPPSGPAIPVTETARSAPVRSRPPVAMAIATWAETAPCAARTSSGTPTELPLELVRVGHEPADEPGARARAPR